MLLHRSAIAESLPESFATAHDTQMVRYKGRKTPPPTVNTLGPAAEQRILDGEPWLQVWSYQLAIPFPTISRKSKIPIARLLEIERQKDMPMQDEFEAIARALGTTVDEIVAVADRVLEA